MSERNDIHELGCPAFNSERCTCLDIVQSAFTLRYVDAKTKQLWIGKQSFCVAILRLADDSFWYVFDDSKTKRKMIETGYRNPEEAAEAAIDVI